jgi:hypothetical protein
MTLLLCRAHHVMLHEGGWRIDFDPTSNTVTVHEPNGQRHSMTGTARAHSP